MNTRQTIIAAAIGIVFGTSHTALAAETIQPASRQHQQVWAISTDNDLFVPTQTDRDFTAGLALTYAGQPGVRYWRGFDNALASVDRWLHLNTATQDSGAITPALEFGVYGFTPDNIEATDLQTNDRPYASLVYLSASRVYRDAASGDAWSTALTIGALGLDVFEAGQNTVHRVIGANQAEGWQHQISDGGELTLRYQAAYHDYWALSSPSAQFKTTYFGSVGYLTEAGVALSTRMGRISSPDYRFNPELIAYGERVNEAATTPFGGQESYFWGGVAVKARAYNAFLQGQFRDSEHTLSGSELRPLLVEAWVGYTLSLARDFKLSYVVRAQSSEIKQGEGDRSLLWGGLVLSQSF